MEKQTLTNFSEQQRIDAMKKYKIIEPYLNNLNCQIKLDRSSILT